ncbi:hypothetical protein ACFL1B_04415 [Nanoarchaeota archaeon]
MDRVKRKRYALSILLTIGILVVLSVLGPAGAVDVELEQTESEESTSFIAEVDVQAEDEVPLKSISIKVDDKTCEFSLEGEPLSEDPLCLDLTIEPIGVMNNEEIRTINRDCNNNNSKY